MLLMVSRSIVIDALFYLNLMSTFVLSYDSLERPSFSSGVHSSGMIDWHRGPSIVVTQGRRAARSMLLSARSVAESHARGDWKADGANISRIATAFNLDLLQ